MIGYSTAGPPEHQPQPLRFTNSACKDSTGNQAIIFRIHRQYSRNFGMLSFFFIIGMLSFFFNLSSDSLGGRSNHLLLKRFRQSALSWQLPHSDNHGITNTLHRISFDSGGPHMVQLHRIHAVSLESVSSMIIFFWIAAWGIASHRDKHSMQQFQTKSLRHQRCTCCHSPVDCHNFALTGRHSWHNTILFIKHTSSRPLAPRYYGAIVLYGCQSQ